MSNAWEQETDERISELKKQHELDIYTLLQAINGWAKNHQNLEEVLRETMKKMELVGSYMCSPTQFKHIFDDKYWKNKEKLEAKE